MKTIPLTKGLFAIVDDADYEALTVYKWHAHEGGKHFYAARVEYHRVEGRTKRMRVWMHRALCLGLTAERPFADHRDGNTLDNRRHNLRPANKSGNAANRPKDTMVSSSPHKGVSWDTARNKWHAQIHVDGKSIHIGRFKDECDAATAYNFAAEAAFGDFAVGNLPAK